MAGKYTITFTNTTVGTQVIGDYAQVSGQTSAGDTANATGKPAGGGKINVPHELVVTAKVMDEVLLGEKEDRLPFDFMDASVGQIARAIALVRVTRCGHVGTGWLIGNQLLLTNYHVIGECRNEPALSNEELAARVGSTVARFDYVKKGGSYQEVKCTELVHWRRPSKDRPDSTGPDALDYAILRLDLRSRNGSRKPLQIRPMQPPLHKWSRINIPQYGDGQPLQYAIRNNRYVETAGVLVAYTTSTTAGTSGAPGCDDDWFVVALHAGAWATHEVRLVEAATERSERPREAVFHYNFGYAIHAILADLPDSIFNEIAMDQGWLEGL